MTTLPTIGEVYRIQSKAEKNAAGDHFRYGKIVAIGTFRGFKAGERDDDVPKAQIASNMAANATVFSFDTQDLSGPRTMVAFEPCDPYGVPRERQHSRYLQACRVVDVQETRVDYLAMIAERNRFNAERQSEDRRRSDQREAELNAALSPVLEACEGHGIHPDVSGTGSFRKGIDGTAQIARGSGPRARVESVTLSIKDFATLLGVEYNDPAED